MIPLVLFAAAFLVRLGVGVLFSGPAYPDSYYYVHVAQQLAAGNGLSTNYLWNLDDIGGRLPVAADLPIAANGLWMPLAELVQLPALWLFGPAGFAGLTFVIIGAFAAPLTYWIGRDAGVGNMASTVAGLLVAVPAGLTPFVAQPDNFALFMVLGPLSLWLCARGMRGDRRAFVLGGLVVGLATLARSDGVLLGLPFALAYARELTPGHRRVIGWTAALGCAALFALAVGPWLYRQAMVFGSLAPSASSGRMLWLIDYQQLFSFSNPPSLESWLGQGIVALAAGRVAGLAIALGLFALLPLAAVLAPFALVGGWQRRSDVAFWPFYVYAVVLFAVTALVFPVLVPHGTFIHAASALVPHTFLLVVVGVASTVRWIALRRPRWDAARATRVFSWATVAVAALAAGIGSVGVTADWQAVRSVQVQLVAPLRAAPGDDRFMAVDPGAINYLSGHQGVLTPADPLPVIESVLRAYDVRWLILERGSIVPALEPVLIGETKPTWLSAPLVAVAGGGTTQASTEPNPAIPAGAVYAVCFDPADTRCAR